MLCLDVSNERYVLPDCLPDDRTLHEPNFLSHYFLVYASMLLIYKLPDTTVILTAVAAPANKFTIMQDIGSQGLLSATRGAILPNSCMTAFQGTKSILSLLHSHRLLE